MQQRHVVRGEFAEPRHHLAAAAGIVRVDARDFIGMRPGPSVGVFPAAAHADEGGLRGQAMLFREERIPRIPFLARLQRRVRRDIGDVKTAPQQLHFRLRLMIPIAALPRPRMAGRGLLRHDHDAAPLPFRRVFHAELFALRRFPWSDRQRLLIHREIEAVEPIAPRGFFPGKGNVHFRRPQFG